MINLRIAGSKSTISIRATPGTSQECARKMFHGAADRNVHGRSQRVWDRVWIDQQPAHVSPPLARARRLIFMGLGPPLNSGEADLAPGQASGGWAIGRGSVQGETRQKIVDPADQLLLSFASSGILPVCQARRMSRARKLVHTASLETLLDYASPVPTVGGEGTV